ncbi:hypothetical protein LCGC14_2922310 [marine sediment metagenome]|uniref:Uncharacterized protein n=1 Tax=marine sediment metagenome TaxID=412755 RepID=A0A0F9AEF8_9ZZZZ
MKSTTEWAKADNIPISTAHQVRRRLGLGTPVASGKVILLTSAEWDKIKSAIQPGRGRPKG